MKEASISTRQDNTDDENEEASETNNDNCEDKCFLKS